jgi:DNA-binding MarR family transcriptional regulator
MRRIQRHLSRRFSEETKDYDLRSGMFSALALIEDNPGIAQTALARAIGQDASAAVAMLEDLEQRGWVRRERRPRDRRRYAIFVTEGGRQVVDTLMGVMSAIEDEVLGGLRPSELLALNYFLDGIDSACRSGQAGLAAGSDGILV